ncbi:ROK family protein [Dysgonomonas macrotermitis]|nr:ROK family protein [Dysgonomonas macrotermitis]
MKKYYIGVDVGGSHICCALVEGDTGKIVDGSLINNEVDSNASYMQITEVWKATIAQTLQQTGNVEGIGIAIPGPFDYENGISLIEGVQKYDSLFAINIKETIRQAFPDRSKPVSFINDATGFALGEYYAGAAKNSKRSLIVTIGTGFGSTFLVEGNVMTEKSDSVPADGYLYNIPFGQSIADDYFSTRWFVGRWKAETGNIVSGVKEIAEYAINNDKRALNIFNEFSSNLAEFITPWLQKFDADTLIIGGSIAKASYLFLDNLKSILKNQKIDKTEVKICKLWDIAPITGSAMNVKAQLNKEDMIKKENIKRKTTQFLAPEKAQPTPQGDYDIYPGFPLAKGTIKSGAEALADYIAEQKTVIIDGYVGVFWNELIQQINEILIKKGVKAVWKNIDAAMKSSDEIAQMLVPYLGEEDSIFGKITDKKLIDWFDKDKLTKIQPEASADVNIIIGCGAQLAGWNGKLIYVDLPKNELQFRMRAGAATNLGADKVEDGRNMYKRFYFVDWIVLNEHKANILPRIDLVVDEQRPDNYLSMSGDDLRKGLSAMSKNFFRVRPWFEPGAWGGTWMKENIKQLNTDVPNLAWSFELMVLENGIMFESDNFRLEVSFDFLMFNNYKEVLGDCAERFKYNFPIRFDFLDTFDGGNLSVQCHPRPEYIAKEFGMPFTQDETYYILNVKNDPLVYLGFQEGVNPDEFHKALVYSQENAKEIDITKYVQVYHAKKHDLYLIPNGTIHASGKDNLVLEISSAPYIFTFKMYDWVRLDLDGRPRPINIDHGMKNVNFELQGQKVYDELISKPYVMELKDGFCLEHLPTHPEHFYDVYRYNFDKEITIETNGKCHVWMLVEGISVIVETADGMKQRFNYAETFVIPAAAKSYKIINEGNTQAMMVKSFVK